MMRRAKTVDNCNLSCNSETKRRMSRQQAKKYKMEKLRRKLNNVVNQLNSLKEETNQDHVELNHLMLSSERIERLTLESREKAKRLCCESLDPKRRLSFPSPVENKPISMFTPNDEVITDDKQALQKPIRNTPMSIICQGQPEAIQYLGMRDDVMISEKEESKMTATNQVRASQENVFVTNVPSQVKEESRISSGNCFSQLSKRISVKERSGGEKRRNRFEEQWTKTQLVVEVPAKKEQKMVVKKSGGVDPLIWAIFLSIVFLWVLSL